jgi:hypothetical protein
VEIEWNHEELRRMTNDILQEEASQLQAALDRVHRLAEGKNLEQVKILLELEWRTKFAAEITDPDLTDYAQTLVEGHRIVVRPELKP